MGNGRSSSRTKSVAKEKISLTSSCPSGCARAISSAIRQIRFSARGLAMAVSDKGFHPLFLRMELTAILLMLKAERRRAARR